MKKITSIVLAVVMLLSVMAVGVVSVSAATTGTTGSCTWSLDDNGVLTISGSGDMGYYTFNNRAPWGTDINSVIIENGVTNIGREAFEDSINLTSVTIPNSVTSIGLLAFGGCTSLENIIIPDSVNNLGTNAFSGSGLKRITLSNSITKIDEGMFASCNSLESINIPNSVVSIEWGAFQFCRNLSEVTIPNSVTKIGPYAFYYCQSLTSVDIPDSVTIIDDWAFRDCTSLENVTIGNSVATIGETAFFDCWNLSDYTIPNSVTDIGFQALGYVGGDEGAMPTPTPTIVRTSNNVGINYLTTNNFRNSILGDYYVNYAEELPENMIIESENSGQTRVTLTTTPANLRVTVPTVLPVSVDADNNVTVATNAQILNQSSGQVDVTNAALSGSNSWTLAAFDTDFKSVPVNTKQYGFKLLGYNVPVSGNAYNNQFSTIDGNSALDLTYDANVAIQSDAINSEEIGTIVFTVAWHK